MLEDATVTCPHCWQPIVLEIDLSAGPATYTEDCSVCCHPLTVTVTFDADGAWQVRVDSENA